MRILTLREVPLLLSLLLGFMSWGLTRIADGLKAGPTLEYTIATQENRSEQLTTCDSVTEAGKAMTREWPCIVEYTFRNLSSRTRLENLKVDVVGHAILGARAVWVSPTSPGANSECRDTTATVPNVSLQPWNEMRLLIALQACGDTSLHLKSVDIVAARPRGLGTFLAGHETTVLVGLVAFAALLAAAYLAALASAATQRRRSRHA